MPDFGSFRGFGEKLVQGQTPTQLGLIGGVTTSGVLDDFPNAGAAYALRRLRTGYLGSLIRVRRSSDNAEMDISYSTVLTDGQINETQLTTFCSGTNGFVTTWYDQSGNARNATQTTAANQPQIVSSGSILRMNGKAICSFDGSNDLMNYDGTFLANNKYAVFQVVTRTSAASLLNMAGSGLNTNLNLHIGYGSTNVYRHAQFGNDYVITIPDFTTEMLQTFALHNYSAGKRILLNNNFMGGNSNTINLISYSQAAFGCGLVQAPYSGKILELIIYGNDQNANTSAITDNINSYYGIY